MDLGSTPIAPTPRIGGGTMRHAPRSLVPRTYSRRGEPNAKVVDPKKHSPSDSANPLIVAVDVTGSMSSWPAEIFDRLPLLYNTLAPVPR